MADDDRFYVKSLTLENFRCFEKTELGPFDPHFNLLVGENGTGKSSVLVALAYLYAAISTPPGAVIRAPWSYSDIRKFVNRSQIFNRPQHTSAGLRSQFKPVGDERLGSKGRQSFSSLYMTHIAEGEREETSFHDPFVAVEDAGAKVEPGVSPIALFYTTDRRFRDAEDRGEPLPPVASPRFAAFAGWSNAGSSGRSLSDWMRDETLAKHQGDARFVSAGANLGEARAGYFVDAVSAALLDAIAGATDVAYIGRERDIVVGFADGSRQPFSRMSDGQRALIGLVADIARRMCILNGQDLGPAVLTETPGLVLIDEIDLHLHPKWQREILGALKRIFPKIQFFATTHSPQVIGEAKPEEIVMLTKDGKQKRPAGSYGMDSNWVLECVMEAEGRDPAIAKQIKDLWTSIEDGEFEAARVQIEMLRGEIGPLAPDLAGAESYMWRMEQEARGADEAAE